MSHAFKNPSSDDLFGTASFGGRGCVTANDVCNAASITTNLATAATIAPINPPQGKVVTGAIGIAGVPVTSFACPLAGRTSF